MPSNKANVGRLKRRLLKDLVQQNVELIHGRVRRAPPVRRLAYLRLGGALALLLLSTSLIGSTRLLSTLVAAPGAPAGPALPGTAGPGAEGTAGVENAGPGPAGLPAGMRTAGIGMPGLASAGAGTGAGLASTSLGVAAGLGAGGFAPVRSGTAPLDPAVLPLAVRKIALDAGHGGISEGTRTPLGLLEKDLTLDIVRRLRELLLDQHAFDVVLTRQDDREVSLADRAAIANRQGADIFVSVHVNWIEDRTARGVETYFLGPTNDPFLNRLAARENHDSGYSMADMRQLLDGIYAGVRQDKSRQLAEMVQQALFRSLGKVNPRIADRGVKSAPFLVLLSTRMPAILAEVSCLSNAEEARLLARPLYRQYIAEALAGGLRAYASAARGSAAGSGG
jgi:N-acetylmuramoyl-L-alanine amidase